MKFKVANIPGNKSEFQLIASEKIRAGDLVIKEHPLVTVPDLPEEQYKFGVHSWDLVERVADDPGIRNIYLSWNLKISSSPFLSIFTPHEEFLSKKYNVDPNSIRLLFRNVVTNNIAYIDENRQIGGFGLYRNLSRSNHSCAPNTIRYAAPKKDFDKNVAGLVAIRDIAKGEPITWSYLGMDSSFLEANYEVRSYFIFERHFFACGCDRCRREMTEDEWDDEVRNKRFWDDWKERFKQIKDSQ